MRQLRPVEQQWLFSQKALENTPSLDDGISLETELKRRKITIEYMRSLALRANALVHGDDAECLHLRGSLVVGSILVHRFYMRKSFKDFEETLIAPTVLFLASKIEEEPLKLRHIVNVTIAKFENGAKGWYPDNNPHEQPTREYRNWEKSILATEEILLETLCFDMGIEQPWNILYNSVIGLDEIISRVAMDKEKIGHMNGNENENGNGLTNQEMLNQSTIKELGWTLLSESLLSPIPILYPAGIIAFTTLIFLISIIDQVPLSESTICASELSERFDLDIKRTDDNLGVQGVDLDMIKACLADILKYMNQGLIDDGLIKYVKAELNEERKEPYRYRFTIKSPPRSSEVKGENVKNTTTAQEGQAIGIAMTSAPDVLMGNA
ncbi:uncharacterized protein I206_106825 [Kwoniella pini CBS 10737]|uniref:Cyclin N-terminal domain-containing protein n=1 Tax=Kwoniella pini CBS 10737 TaxID=1296096 RepID=A0A1B9HZY5_9TREE|nr:uncharacterized protein I206_05630 [Kwoniella pini CBS 10737]OCF48849.1 hypothetical protein I206_05630 [Kwoniella pini CBS 10737]